MAYLNEFPHFESSKLNLDWLLEQYSTFNERIEEIKTAFNEAVEQFETDLQDFETDVNTAISNFETSVIGIISNFKTETNEEISEFETSVTNEINSLTNNMVEYIQEHMDEWQSTAFLTVMDGDRFAQNVIAICDCDYESQATEPFVDFRFQVNLNKYIPRFKRAQSVSITNLSITTNDGYIKINGGDINNVTPDVSTQYAVQYEDMNSFGVSAEFNNVTSVTDANNVTLNSYSMLKCTCHIEITF